MVNNQEKNIRLIATDMDGTFLDDNKQFDMEFFDLFEKMKKRDIKFVIASGQQYQKLFQRFLPASLDMIFIAENGSIVVDGTKVIKTNVIADDDFEVLMDQLNKYDDLLIVVCGRNSAYALKKDLQYKDVVRTYYAANQFIEDFHDIDDEILKVAVYDPDYSIQRYYEQVSPYLPEAIKVVTSGNEWMDIQNKSINKGIAMKSIQEIYGISPEESMAFGDQMNDYELLQQVKYSYAMANAVPRIKEIAYDTCASNEEQGVLTVIAEYLNEKGTL